MRECVRGCDVWVYHGDCANSPPTPNPHFVSFVSPLCNLITPSPKPSPTSTYKRPNVSQLWFDGIKMTRCARLVTFASTLVASFLFFCESEYTNSIKIHLAREALTFLNDFLKLGVGFWKLLHFLNLLIYFNQQIWLLNSIYNINSCHNSCTEWQFIYFVFFLPLECDFKKIEDSSKFKWASPSPTSPPPLLNDVAWLLSKLTKCFAGKSFWVLPWTDCRQVRQTSMKPNLHNN